MLAEEFIVLDGDSRLWQAVRSLLDVIVHTKDFHEGYERGRRDYFMQYEEIAHTEDDLLDLLKARAQENLGQWR